MEKDSEKFGYGEVELVRGADGEPWSMTGIELVHNKYKQPIFGDQGVEGEFVYADYVTLDDGTGIVHGAPGHGVDDYLVGMKFDIPVVMPVDDDGRFYKGDEMGTGRSLVWPGSQRGQSEDHRVAARAWHAHPPRGHQP